MSVPCTVCGFPGYETEPCEKCRSKADPDNLVNRLRRMSRMASDKKFLETAHITREAASEIEWLRSRVEEMNEVFGKIRMKISLPEYLAKEVDQVMVQEHRE